MELRINSGDMAGILMIAVQALEKQNREMKAENADLKARLERLERMIGGLAVSMKSE
ncbi:MAG: hypothetical protein HYY45_21700 [Deltaproteobacteria bacterium]|nr:hypothetical protein [Deltaproteobacteria bacterium]